MSKRILPLCCAGLLALAGCGGGAGRNAPENAVPSARRGPPPAAEAPPERCTVEVYGDSIMASNGTSERPLATWQKRRPALTFIDHSAPEVLLTDLGRRFNGLPRKGRWVVIQAGVVDAWRNVKPALYVQTLHAIIEQVRAEGREPILTGFTRQVATPALNIRKAQLIRRDQYDALTQLVAAQMKVSFVDWGAVHFEGIRDLQDGMHPDFDYSHRLFERLFTVLDNLSGCR